MAGTDDGVTHRVRDVSGKLSLALGEVAVGFDEIYLEGEIQLLDLVNQDPDLFSLEPLDGFDSITEGQGAVVIPQRVGIGYVTPVVSGRSWDPIEVTISPQKLIQILVGEARGELSREATLDNGSVQASSVSVTGEALGAVIRNRIDMINDRGTPSLFEVDSDAYEDDPPLSYYEAVIEANDGIVYQFSPVDPIDPSQESYLNAASRFTVSDEDLDAYDQAVLTAAAVFNEDSEDATKGAFAFFSPTEDEYKKIQEALESGTIHFPEDAGTSEAQFPALTPIQVLVLDGIAPSSSDRDIPSFVFVRMRDRNEPAVTDQP